MKTPSPTSELLSERKTWKPQGLLRGYKGWIITLAIIIYLIAVGFSLEINWLRVQMGLSRSARLFGDFFRPDFIGRWPDIINGVIESLTMTVGATVIGVALSIPLAFGAARNISPKLIYFICRGVIIVSRSFQEIIIAILFVVMLGFGPLAGMLTLVVASIGFVGKLLAEDIEDIDTDQLEAIRATGATWLQTMIYGVWPQIMPRFVGLGVYRLDINFRESSVIGVVGAGGIGATLNTAFRLYEFSTVSAVLIIIIAIVLFTEYCSGIIRRRLQ